MLENLLASSMLLAEGALAVLLVVVVVPLLLLVVMYNGHVSRRNAVDYAFSSIDVQLKKRWDLIPRLVETAKGFAKHERELLERVVHARSQAMKRGSEDRLHHEGEISRNLPMLFALSESYPELKSDGQFMNLQRNLTEVESQISASRRAYNAAVTAYNDGVQMFPSSVVAGMFGFSRREWFQIESVEREVSHVSL